MTTDFVLGALSTEMEYATIQRWLVAEGDDVTAGAPIVEVEADKASYELEAPVSGMLAEIVAEEGDEVKVGALLAVID